eukprot:COSAG05_NODE_1469_length_4793_cov_5883.461014_2_plen_202_part_01
MLAGHLKVVSNIKEEGAGEGCIAAVTTVLESLARCLDPVARASRVLVSADVGTRMRGLEVLRALPRVVLAASEEAEASVVHVVGEIGCDESRGDGEREAAWMAFFVLWYRNGAATLGVVAKYVVEGVGSVVGVAFSGRLQGREGLSVLAAWSSAENGLDEIALKHVDPTVRASAEKTLLAVIGAITKLDCAAARYTRLISVM